MWGQNRRLLNRLNSALEMRQRPTAALLELPDPYTGWTTDDYKLQEAVITLNKEKCKECGNPIWLCHVGGAVGNEVEFLVKTAGCYGKGAVMEYESDKSNPELEPGEYHYAVAVGIENETGDRDPLPSREAAFAQMALDD